MTLREGPLGLEKKVQLDQIIFGHFPRIDKKGLKNDLNTDTAGKS